MRRAEQALAGEDCVKKSNRYEFLLVLVRVISWIVFTCPAKQAIHEITRTNTNERVFRREAYIQSTI